MPYRETGIGILFKEDPEKARQELLETFRSVNGNLNHAAHLLGISRRHLYKLVYREDLWDEIEQIRADYKERRRDSDWLRRAREELRR